MPAASHDFDAIPHSGCSYDTSGSLNINVDTILGGGKEEAMTEEEYEDVYGDYNPDAEVIAQEEVRCQITISLSISSLCVSGRQVNEAAIAQK